SDDIGNKEKENEQGKVKSRSYADVAGQKVNMFDKNLLEIPTELDSDGNEIVVFDKVMIAEGSKRWEKTLYGYFVGYGLSVNELRPWIVKNKPLIICNVPLEAWTVKGISALAGRVGKPLVMDSVTASMCNLGVLRTGFARVLVEVKANKALPSEIEIVYKNGAKEEICRKSVKVLYDWKPPCCTNCCVSGHNNGQCRKNKTRNAEKVHNISSDK
ncbi:hypothetical protein Tco_0159657, partial [Tanacetum coccineum]